MNIFGFGKKKDHAKSHEERLVPAKKEKRLLNSYNYPKGHCIFQYNAEHGTIERVDVVNSTDGMVLLGGHIKAGYPKPKLWKERKAWVGPRCMGFHALNRWNAKRKVALYEEAKLKGKEYRLANMVVPGEMPYACFTQNLRAEVSRYEQKYGAL